MSGIATLKAEGAEDRTAERWGDLLYQQLNRSIARGQLTTSVDAVMIGFRAAGPLVMLWLGAMFVLEGSMTPGTMLALNALGSGFISSVGLLLTSVQQVQRTAAHVERLLELMETVPEQNVASVRGAPALLGGVELRHVSFRYYPHAPLTLQDVSLLIRPGEKVALVGRTGSGKSTLAMLLLALYVPTDGTVLYDSRSIDDLDYRSVRRQFGVVLQEPFLFDGSIRDSIAAHRNVNLDDIARSARLACIHDEIVQMPMGYEMMVAERGAALSGGQRQRLALARAMVGEPAILLLDEATSQLDVVTEQAIERNLQSLGCTRIVIAHRLSTVRDADLIVVLDCGRIVECGSHDELVAVNGLYAQLTRTQREVAL